MNFSILRKSDQNTSRWSGGTTTQLAIFPEGSEFQKYNFIFRISFATVEVPSSTFTFMPGVTRHLMILEGGLTIHHTDRYSKELKPFNQDVFNGEWPTTAEGKVKDFNLLLREGATGSLRYHSLNAAQNLIIDGAVADVFGIYIQTGSVKFICPGNDEEKLEAGDFLYITSDRTAMQFLFTATESANVIVTEVKITE